MFENVFSSKYDLRKPELKKTSIFMQSNFIATF